MDAVNLERLAKMLQISITPVALISGVGLLLLSMTNRLGRCIDRARSLSRDINENPNGENQKSVIQIKIIYQRSRNLRMAISLASLSIFCASLIVVLLFAIHVAGIRFHETVMVFFTAGMLLLIASIVLFIKDIGLSLRALKLEIEEHL